MAGPKRAVFIMKNIYDHQKIEEKWQQAWEDAQLFQDTTGNTKHQALSSKLYLLFAFAYPSGSGLHVGHVESKTALDILARYYRMHGKDVFFPVGWDAFGLPAENYAIKTGIPPVETTKNAIDTFRRQLKRIGISYDWANEIATCHPGYYKWTQWIFLQLYKKGLAYQKMGKVNWCPSCQTVLANEQVVDGQCERCDSQVEQKDMKQWYFQITKYQDELISGLEQVDWPEPTKAQQLNWIGKKTGIDIDYQIEKTDKQITCFTTRPDTNFGATFVVLAPEHEFSQEVAKENTEVATYIKKAEKKTELERQQDGKKKSGAFTGYYAINNLNGKKMPIWVSDFVLSGFGTGAVVGVPGHDTRDFEFAQFVNDKYPDEKIEVIRVVVASDGDDSPITSVDQVQEEEGTMINSEFLDGLDIHEATVKIMDHLEEKGWGKRVTTYKLRDWLISRQRYWGAPIPIIYDPDGNPHAIKEEHLPWKLAEDVDFKPTGESPLVSSQELQERTEKYAVENFADVIRENGWDKSGKGWRSEFDTMDTFVDSSWYYLRYTDSRNEEEFASKTQLEKWLPVDFYMIGPEHIVLHLLYSRFFTKFLRDEGYLNFDEPFMKMRHQGMILGPDGKKMSKSKGNVINPDDVVEKFGADTLRVYEMFMGPIEADKPWDVSAVAGVYRFLRRIHFLVAQNVKIQMSNFKSNPNDQSSNDLQHKLHQTIQKVSDDIPKLKFNTAIAEMMKFVNVWEQVSRQQAMPTGRKAVGSSVLSVDDMIAFVKLLAPFAPFLAEELYDYLRDPKTRKEKTETSIHIASWPEFDPELAKEDEITIAVQVNGKVRAELALEGSLGFARDDDSKDEILKLAKDLDKVQKWLDGKTIVKEIYVPGKIVNFVVSSK